MGKFAFNFIFFIFFVLGIGYLLLPAPQFPEEPVDSVQSVEEWDTESSLRRGYMTNKSRLEIIDHYLRQMSHVGVFMLPAYRLNYPTEEVQSLIRDQVRSTYLEELVHPFRESLYVSGYEPNTDDHEIWYKGVFYGSKVTVKYVPSDVVLRILLFIAAIVMLRILCTEMGNTLRILYKEWV